MPASPLIVMPYPSQIAAGQPLDANAVQQDLQTIASAFNVHGHSASDISGLGAAGGGDVWLPGEMKMFPGGYVPSVIGCIMPCLGATFWVASVHPACASAVGTFWGGNASILKLPDYGGRSFVAMATSGNAAVATQGTTDGVALANRRGLKHQHTPHIHTVRNVTGGGGILQSGTNARVGSTSLTGGAAEDQNLTGVDGGSGTATDPVDGGAFGVGGMFIRVL